MSKDSKAKKTKKHYKSLEKKTALWGLIFLLPWLIGLIFFFLRPLFLTFYYAFNSMEMESGVFKGTFNGIENFKYALGVDADFTKDLASAFTSMLTNVPIQIFVSLFIAILLNGCGLSMSNYVRRTALGQHPRQRLSEREVEALCSLTDARGDLIRIAAAVKSIQADKRAIYFRDTRFVERWMIAATQLINRWGQIKNYLTE